MGRHPASFATSPAPEVHKPDAYIPARDPDTRTVAHIDEQTADALEEMDDEFADDAFLELSPRAHRRAQGARRHPPLRRRRPDHPRRLHLRGDRPVGGPPRRRPPSSRVPSTASSSPSPSTSSRKNPSASSPPSRVASASGYPASNMPTLLVYRHRDVARTRGTRRLRGRRLTPEGVRLALNECGPVCRGLSRPERSTTPTSGRRRRPGGGTRRRLWRG